MRNRENQGDPTWNLVRIKKESPHTMPLFLCGIWDCWCINVGCRGNSPTRRWTSLVNEEMMYLQGYNPSQWGRGDETWNNRMNRTLVWCKITLIYKWQLELLSGSATCNTNDHWIDSNEWDELVVWLLCDTLMRVYLFATLERMKIYIRPSNLVVLN